MPRPGNPKHFQIYCFSGHNKTRKEVKGHSSCQNKTKRISEPELDEQMQASTQTQNQPPLPASRPYFWKLPSAPAKDYLSENVRRIRAVSSDVKKAKQEPMKATFIPGVTKNPKYEHVPSRLAGIIRGTEPNPNGGYVNPLMKSKSHPRVSSLTSQSAHKFLPDKYNPILNGNLRRIESHSINETKPIWGASQAANAKRLSRSTTDLSQKKTPQDQRVRNQPMPPRRSRPLRPQDESVYNWRFSDVNNMPPPNHRLGVGNNAEIQDAKNLHYHKVEYLPCDGICADENIVTGHGDGNLDSGRSSTSSTKTSRGVNTEETRIIEEAQGLRRVKSMNTIKEYQDRFVEPSMPSRFNAQISQKETHPDSDYEYEEANPPGKDLYYGKSDAQMNRIRNELSSLRMHNGSKEEPPPRPVQAKMPHTLGTVPKYLKQRQQEWKSEAEAQKELEKLKDVPLGYRLLSEEERLRNLMNIRREYDDNVNALNMLPVHIDTLRIREERIRLEQTCTKLEIQMRELNRQRVFEKCN